MILRRPEYSLGADSSGVLGVDDRPKTVTGSDTPLKWRITLLTASMVAIAVGMMMIAAYWSVSAALRGSVDNSLDAKASAMLERSTDPAFFNSLEAEVERFKDYNPDTRISISAPGWTHAVGDNLPVLSEKAQTEGYRVSTVSGERVLVKRSNIGATVMLARDMTQTNRMITTLGIALLVVAGLGVLLAFGTGVVVSSTVFRPISRLRNAVRYITETDDLRPIEVSGNDEIAQLANNFNEMLEALRRSRQRQTELVADAGHELKTPLTSMRTNIELLMMMQNSDNHRISLEDKRALQEDVIAQMEELSTLIGDLVDLARQDTPEKALEEVDLVDVIDASLVRVRRRRSDVEFEMSTIPWYLDGDSFALGRAIINLLDNAAKWSPNGGTVRLKMEQRDAHTVCIMVADSGPGIPVEDREKVFDRFYRSVQARSTPGSGLGLAIVQSTIERHGGTIVAGESDDGGALMTVLLPGFPDDEELSECRKQLIQYSGKVPSTLEEMRRLRHTKHSERRGKC